MTEEKIAKTFKKQLFWVSVIAIVVIFFMGAYINSLNSRLDSYSETLRNDYDYRCGDGLKRLCVDENKDVAEIGEDETYAICDTDRKEKAICIDEDASWTQCNLGEFAWCIDRNLDWTTCSIGEDARCITKGRSATISDTGVIRECSVGESATCINWNTQSICTI